MTKDYWDLRTYTLEDPLKDMLKGRDVSTNDDGTVLKGWGNYVAIYRPRDSTKKGHGHAGFDDDNEGKLKSAGACHN